MKIKITVFLLFLLHAIACVAQAPEKQWDARFGGTVDDVCNIVIPASSGGYLLGGTSYSGQGGDKSQPDWGGGDYWIVKVDSSGNKLWDARYGGTKDDVLLSVCSTTDGGYILGGSSKSDISGDKTQASWGSWDYWIVKINADGILLWDARFGGTADDVLEGIQQTSDNGFILGGYSKSDISGDKTQNNRGGEDYWIVKTDSLGIKQWDYRFGGNQIDYLSAIQQTSDDGYILAGYTGSGVSGDKSQPVQGGIDYWIVKTDSSGVKEWDADFGGSLTDNLFAVEQTSDGGFILGGESGSQISGDKTQNTQGQDDYWIVKTDSFGIKQWDADFGGSDYDGLKSLQQTLDGGYILSGGSESLAGGDKSQDNLGASDYWLVKTDADGIKEWDEEFGGTDADYSSNVKQLQDSTYVIAGYSFSSAGGDKSQDSQGGSDYWLVKTNKAEVATHTNELLLKDSLGVAIYPNPVKSSAIITFTLNQASRVSIDLFSLEEKKAKMIIDQKFSAGNHSLQFNRSSLADGIYFLKLTSGNINQIMKLVLTK